ncbi:hypothetical protein [Sporosarcina sp. Marseille-Q4943]|uniref:hypothetical protein n=1 Tax=Sporosarcina sp. Marseille-Q4943 TaxID=2942204 RepID=UPI00208DB579|nr:hypothetical protein [Sporosarcina sp. Marseille-Q4943]
MSREETASELIERFGFTNDMVDSFFAPFDRLNLEIENLKQQLFADSINDCLKENVKREGGKSVLTDMAGFCKRCRRWLDDKEFIEHPAICSECKQKEGKDEV